MSGEGSVESQAVRPPAVNDDGLAEGLFCPHCNYDLRGSAATHCSECGKAIDRDEGVISRIPWVRRREIGRVRAYWKTVAMVMFRPGRVGREVVRPVSFADAVRFRRVTVCLAFVPLAALLVWGTWGSRPFAALALGMLHWPSAVSSRVNDPEIFPSERGPVMASEVVLLMASLLALFLFLAAASGTACYFFRPRNLPAVRQDRATALSYYACAPLALTPFTLGLAALAWWLSLKGDVADVGFISLLCLLFFAAGTLAVAQILQWLNVPMRMLRAATGCGAGRAWALALSLPLLDLLLAVLTLAGIPLVVACVLVVLASLR